MADGTQLEKCVSQFEAAWRTGQQPAIREFLPLAGTGDDECRQVILHELICIDLEYRWRKEGRVRNAQPWRLEDYLHELPELGPISAVPLWLLAEEFRVRHRFGDRPPADLFRSRFADLWPELEPLLTQSLAELKQEFQTTGSTSRPSLINDIALDAPIPYQDFILRQMVGEGRMGKVYRAWQRSLQREVALKFLRKSFLNDADATRRFVREARIVAQLRHPSILPVHGLGRTPYGGYFMVLDLVRGHDLATLAKEQPLAVEQALGWIKTAADALAHAHQRGIIHCDLKPANLLVDEDGRLLVADFGLARTWNTANTSPHEVAGTAPFMAPEQIEPTFGSIGPWTDVYALGAVLYTLLVGMPPYEGETLADILAQVVAAPSPTISGLMRTNVPQEVSEVCMRCMRKNPIERYSTMHDLTGALRASIQR
jgi:eukaryotic-like serine/threonine-protein kinase